MRWATARAAVIAGDPARSDAEVDAEVQGLRRATLLAAISGEQEPARVLAQAEAQLASAPQAQPAPAANTSPAVASPAALADEPAHLAPVAARAVGLPDAQPARPQKPRTLEPALRGRLSRLAPLLKQLRGGR